MKDIIFLLDESGSMLPYKNLYIKGINTFISTQKHDNPDANFSMIKFNNKVKTLCIDSKMHTLPEFTTNYYTPEGSTALYDAIGYVIDTKFSNNIQQVIVIILTDGEDNYSSKYDLDSISKMIVHVKLRGWVFVYIAANQNAQVIGNKLGIELCLTYNETTKSIDHVADVCSIAVGHAIYKLTGIPNKYCEKEIPIDVSELTNFLENITI